MLYKISRVAYKSEDLTEDYAKLQINISTNSYLCKLVISKLIDNRYTALINDTLNQLYKFEGIDKKQLAWLIKMLSAYSQHKELRNVLGRLKVVENLNAKFLQVWNKKPSWNQNNIVAKNIIFYLVSLSYHQDMHAKLIDKKVLEMYLEILDEGKIKGFLCEKIILLLSNCAFSGEVKPHYIANKRIPEFTMTILSSNMFDIEIRVIASQLLYNLVYKCSEAIIIFNKEDVINELTYLSKEFDRDIDKLELGVENPTEQQVQLTQQNKTIRQNIGNVLEALSNSW